MSLIGTDLSLSSSVIFRKTTGKCCNARLGPIRPPPIRSPKKELEEQRAVTDGSIERQLQNERGEETRTSINYTSINYEKTEKAGNILDSNKPEPCP